MQDDADTVSLFEKGTVMGEEHDNITCSLFIILLQKRYSRVLSANYTSIESTCSTAKWLLKLISYYKMTLLES